MPAAAAIVLTVMVQFAAAAASVPPARVMLLLPAAAVGVPPQPLTRPLGVEMSSPAGRVSVKASPLWAGLPAPLVMVRVSWLLEPSIWVAGANALLSVVPTTVSVLERAFEVSPPANPVMLPTLVFG